MPFNRSLLLAAIVAGLSLAGFSASTACAQTGRKTVRIPVRPASPRERETEERHRERLKQWNRDLAHWRRELQNDGNEPAARQRALFHLAAGYEATGKYSSAVESLETLLAEFPGSPWQTDATIRLFDLKLEREGDVAAAKELAVGLAKTAEAWTERQLHEEKQAAEEDSQEPPAAKAQVVAPAIPQAVPAVVLEPQAEKFAIREAYRRAAMVAFLEGRMPVAKRYFFEARPVGRLTAGDDLARRKMFTRAAFMLQSNAFPVPREARSGDGEAAVLLGLAHLLQLNGDADRPIALCSRVIGGKDIEPTKPQQSYARFLRGRCYYADRDEKQRKKSRPDYLAAQRLAAEADWAGDALYLAANTWWNLDRNGLEAVKLWHQAMEEYPQHREAPRAAYYIGIAYETNKLYPEARRSFEELKKRFPESDFVALADEHLKDLPRK